MMHKVKYILIVVFIGLVISLSSCKGTKIKSGRDCGCGSFGMVEKAPEQEQQ